LGARLAPRSARDSHRYGLFLPERMRLTTNADESRVICKSASAGRVIVLAGKAGGDITCHVQDAIARLGAWGLLPIAVPLAVYIASRLSMTLFSGERASVRVLGGAVAAAALFVIGARVLAAAGLLKPAALLASLLAASALLSLGRFRRRASIPWHSAISVTNAPALALCGAGLALAVLAARWVPVWQWDALGYHLPFVNFVLQRGTLADVPQDVPYLSTYPHDVELLYAVFRAMLPDDRLVDLGQLPLGLLGGLATAALARRAGARPDDALAVGALWLTLPAVFLQLPSNYVDVASASFLLASFVFVLEPPRRATLIGALLSVGLYLGSKPSSPPGALLVLALLVWRWRTRSFWVPVLAGAGVVTLLGAESLISNLLRHGNPAWPVCVRDGGLGLPCHVSVEELLAAGAAAPRATGPLPQRIVQSWTSLVSLPAFDMRLGGFGPLFLLAVPVALVLMVRRRATIYVVPAIASLATPDPSVARYVFAFTALAMALAAPALGRLTLRARLAAHYALCAAGAWNLLQAQPGLTGEGPPLHSYASLSESERQIAVGAWGPPTAFREAVGLLAPGEATAFDAGMDLPYLAWPPDLSTLAVRLPDGAPADTIERILDEWNVRLLAAGIETTAGRFARAHPSRFVPLFECRSGLCTVFRVL